MKCLMRGIVYNYCGGFKSDMSFCLSRQGAWVVRFVS